MAAMTFDNWVKQQNITLPAQDDPAYEDACVELLEDYNNAMEAKQEEIDWAGN
ncbi:MAG: hypothetical protein MJA83_10275 [Gammaproteobacteria bacterium]|nr:hypothetical protein [Gammaproteobacteria bacterium]